MVVEYIKDIGTARFCVFGRLLFRFVRANEKKVSVGERRRNGAGTDVFCEAFYFSIYFSHSTIWGDMEASIHLTAHWLRLRL